MLPEAKLPCQPAAPPPPQKPPEEPPHPSETTCPEPEATLPATCLKEGQLRCFKGLDELFLPLRIPTGEEVYGESVRLRTKSLSPTCALRIASFSDVTVSETAGWPHACSLCPKSFRLKTSLLIHQKTHTVVKSDSPFVCSQCSCSFSHQAQLTQHQTKHAYWPHQCSECHKAFNCKSSLVAHQKTHRERLHPFQCLQCNRTFIRKHHLDDHTRTHTGKALPVSRVREVFHREVQADQPLPDPHQGAALLLWAM
ncbi:hypothetical protein E2320_000084 [Naja naja]|nr:hypothetical protein E2320_000084 [Naja naja]